MKRKREQYLSLNKWPSGMALTWAINRMSVLLSLMHAVGFACRCDSMGLYHWQASSKIALTDAKDVTNSRLNMRVSIVERTVAQWVAQSVTPLSSLSGAGFGGFAYWSRVAISLARTSSRSAGGETTSTSGPFLRMSMTNSRESEKGISNW